MVPFNLVAAGSNMPKTGGSITPEGDKCRGIGVLQAQNSRMTLDQVCQEAQALTPAAAHMASLMLPLAGPMAAAWQTHVELSLAAAARGSLPLGQAQTADLLDAALHPDDRAGWLIGKPSRQTRCSPVRPEL